MMEAAEQDFKFISNEDFLEKCKNPEQKDAITKFLHTDDSYYCDLKIDAESIDQVNDPNIKLLLIPRLNKKDFIKVVDKLINENNKKLIKDESYKKDDEIEEEEEDKDDDEKINFKKSTLTYDYFLSYFLKKNFNEFSSPIEIYWFLQKCLLLGNLYRLIFQDYFENKLKELFSKYDFDLHNYFYTNRKNYVFLMRPKQEFFDLCVEKGLGAWAGYAFVYLPRSKQTKENFLKVPKEFQVSALATLRYNSWKLIDCLSTSQKQELVDKKIITEKGFLNKKAEKIWLTVFSICLAIALAGLIASCILAPVFGPIAAPIFIALFALDTILGIIDTICSGCNLDKINKFNKEIGSEQSETTTLTNDTNNLNVAAEVGNENVQGNDSPNKHEPQPPMDYQNQFKNQNSDRT